jgi:hypothetical protein
MTIESSRQIFEKYSNINFTKIHLVGDESFHAGRQDKANHCFSWFYKHAWEGKIHRFFWYPVSLGTLFQIWRQISGPIFKSWTLLMRPLHCLETLETDHSVMQGHSSEEQVPLPYHCENLKTHVLKTWRYVLSKGNLYWKKVHRNNITRT